MTSLPITEELLRSETVLILWGHLVLGRAPLRQFQLWLQQRYLRGSVLLSLCGELLVSHAFTPFALALVFTFSQETFIPSATWWEDGVKQRVEGLPNTSLVCAGGVLFTVKSSQVWGTSRRSPYPPRSVVGASAELKRWSGRWLRRILPCMGN